MKVFARGHVKDGVTPVDECCPVVIGYIVVNVGPRVRIVQNEPGEEAGRAEHATEHSHGQPAESSGQPRQRIRVPAREEARHLDAVVGQVGGERRLTRPAFEHVLPRGDIFTPCVMSGAGDVFITWGSASTSTSRSPPPRQPRDAKYANRRLRYGPVTPVQSPP